MGRQAKRTIPTQPNCCVRHKSFKCDDLRAGAVDQGWDVSTLSLRIRALLEGSCIRGLLIPGLIALALLGHQRRCLFHPNQGTFRDTIPHSVNMSSGIHISFNGYHLLTFEYKIYLFILGCYQNIA